MNWHIVLIDGEWRLVDNSGQVLATASGDLEGKGVVLAQLRDLVGKEMEQLAAVANEIAPEAKGARFEAVFEEGEQSVDRRIIEENATNFDRPPPLPFMFMTENPEFGGHAGAKLGGVVDEALREGKRIILRGHFDAGSEAGQEAQRLVSDGVLSWWSPDFGNTEVETEVTEVDDDGWPVDWLDHLMSGTILAVTACPIQALTSARIRILEEGSNTETETQEPAETTEEARATTDKPAVTAAAAPVVPPAEWFEDPQLKELTPLTITDEGRVFGHLAPWGTCHIGVAGECVTAPPSNTDYSYFHTGAIKASGCDCDIPVGQITMGADHLTDLHADFRQASAHYANNATAVADIVAGEDEHGIWFSGAMRSGVTDEQVRALRASALSGDWRPVRGGLELVAALAVNVPGYGIPRTRVLTASGQPKALVAAGVQTMVKLRDPEAKWRIDIESRLRVLDERTAPLRGMAASGLRERIASGEVVTQQGVTSTR